jgi:predicted dienelactone hydrolase
MIKTLTLSLCSAFLVTLPVVGAEQIILTFGPWRGSVRVNSLEIFAKDKTINQNLKFFLGRASQEQQEQFREALVKRVDINPVLLSRFFNSKIGEDILERVGQGITIQGGRNGKFALRAAMVQAAFAPEGLTLLNVLRKFPTNMQLQGDFIIELSNTIDRIITATNYFTEKIARLSVQEARANPIDFSQLADLRQSGKFNFRRETFTLTDSRRQRTFLVILYVPETGRTGKTPVVIVSHGLGSRPEDFEDVAKHLASYGYVVAIPQHPGSDTQRKQDFIDGFASELFAIEEFIDRPQDISTTIDELERRDRSEFGGRLDLENVGVWGHSFGGYAALAVAGAPIDFDHLQSVCALPFRGLNMSLLLQCRALSLPRQTYEFRDPRVKAVLTKNPFNSAIFGPKMLAKIQIPIMIIGGNFDPATPFVLEQVRAFTWLTSPDKYLGLIEGQAHVNLSQLDAGITDILEAIPNLELAESDLVDSYRDPMNVAFFETYLAKDAQFRPYLTSAYAEYLSQNQPFRFYLIDSSSQRALQQAIQQF